MKKRIHVALVTPEFSPLVRSGELADVAASLPRYLVKEGVEVTVFMPRYRRPEIDSLPMEVVIPELFVPLGSERVRAQVLRTEVGRVPLFFIDNPRFFYRSEVYGPATSGYLDNDARFIFFNRAVLEFLARSKIEVDVIHCHNWPTALVPVFLRTHYQDVSHLKNVATVFTVHNAAYQGEFPAESLVLTGLNWDYFTPQKLALNGRFNFLKAGLVFADITNTVSSTYKHEIQKKAAADELGWILQRIKNRFYSIRSGIDYDSWDPGKDRLIAATYTADDLSGKKVCKKDLIREMGLKIESQTPLIGLVSYVSPLKGIDLLLGSLEAILRLDVGLIICGQGDEALVLNLMAESQRFPGRLVVKTETTEALMHQVFAGCDFILIPSREEPCGLNQFYAFRYGTVPVARAVGGLKETIVPFNSAGGKGNGFLFSSPTRRGLLMALRRAINCYRHPEVWNNLVRSIMQQDFSWSKPGKRYIQLYLRAIELRKGGKEG